MNFGQAIELMKTGKRVARAGWNGKGMFVYLVKGSISKHELGARADSTTTCMGVVIGRIVGGVKSDLFELGDDGTTTRMPNLNMRAADGSVVTGWLASQTDMLAEDWSEAQ